MEHEEFNEKYPVLGQKVILTDDTGQEHFTSTRAKAYDLCGTSVVACVGFTAYELSRIRVVEDATV